MYKKACKRAAVPIGALLGNLDGVRLLGLLREKENAYLSSFFLDPEDIKTCLETIWRFELISDYGAQRALL